MMIILQFSNLMVTVPASSNWLAFNVRTVGGQSLPPVVVDIAPVVAEEVVDLEVVVCETPVVGLDVVVSETPVVGLEVVVCETPVVA
jgi:hypothetical protein